MHPNIKDVAKTAGVSISTVSLVINKKPNVAETTRQRVLEAIKDLQYHPRRTARGLASKKSGNIGFIVSHDHFTTSEPFYTRIFLGTEFETRCTDYYILLTTIERTFSLHTIPRFLLERNVDGVILAGFVPYKILEYIQERDLPIVLIDYAPPGGKFSKILIDNKGGCERATRHFINAGHRRIAFIGGDMSHPSIKGRFDGYKTALAHANLAFAPELVCCDQAQTGDFDGYKAACSILERRVDFTAMIAANDAMAIGAMRALRDHKIRIPKNVAIIGFDDVEAARNTRPTLTTLCVPKEEMGALAVRQIIQAIDRKSNFITNTIVPVELVIRESCGTNKKTPV